jgi:hypothetical protein
MPVNESAAGEALRTLSHLRVGDNLDSAGKREASFVSKGDLGRCRGAGPGGRGAGDPPQRPRDGALDGKPRVGRSPHHAMTNSTGSTGVGSANWMKIAPFNRQRELRSVRIPESSEHPRVAIARAIRVDQYSMGAITK